MEADISTQAVGLASSADFSLTNLFIRADIIVKSVIILLIACSIYSWAVIIEKIRLFKKINQSTEEFETKFWNSKSAETFYNNLPTNTDDPMALIFKDAMQNLLKRRSKSDLNNRNIEKINFFPSERIDIEFENKKKIRFPINFTINDLNFGFRVLNNETFSQSKIIDLRIPNKVITYD